MLHSHFTVIMMDRRAIEVDELFICLCHARLAGEGIMFVCLSVTKLVNMVFWKRINRFWCKSQNRWSTGQGLTCYLCSGWAGINHSVLRPLRRLAQCTSPLLPKVTKTALWLLWSAKELCSSAGCIRCAPKIEYLIIGQGHETMNFGGQEVKVQSHMRLK